MNTAKFYEIFDPSKFKEQIHIIGCGAGGSSVAELLARYGLSNITLYDFDTVESHNIANQMFRDHDIGLHKAEALKKIMAEINPDIATKIKLEKDGWNGQKLNGYVFLCVDNIELRKEIVKANKRNLHIKAMFDFRNRLYDAQHYAADWSKSADVTNLLNSMDFTHEEAMAETPLSACNLVLSVAPTVRLIACYGVMNFINFLQGKALQRTIDVMSSIDEAYFGFETRAFE